MVHCSDLTTGEVIQLISGPKGTFGWARIVDGKPDDIGETVWFHGGDGEYISSYDGYFLEWDGPFLKDDVDTVGTLFGTPEGQLRRIAPPRVGNRIVFEAGRNGKGPKALKWTHEQYFQEVIVRKADMFRVVNANGTVLWRGRFHGDAGLVGTIEGALPLKLDESMTLEYLRPDDFDDQVDEDCNVRSILVPGSWVGEEDNSMWGELLKATSLVLVEN